MKTGKEKQSFTNKQRVNNVFSRNLSKSQLGGVIFGCTRGTLEECLVKQLFGLPAQHFQYVQNIDPGLPLFLFNYSGRTLLGIFEAASPGQLNINPYGWTANGLERTQYPAQVQVRVRKQCRPLPEDQFRRIIAENYFKPRHFWFELDHAQTGQLISLLSSGALAPSIPPQDTANCRPLFHAVPSLGAREIGENPPAASQIAFSNPDQSSLVSSDGTTYSEEENQLSEADPNGQHLDNYEKDRIYLKLKELALKVEYSEKSLVSHVEEDTAIINDIHLEGNIPPEPQMVYEVKSESNLSMSDIQSSVPQLIHEVAELKAFHTAQIKKMGSLENKLVEAKAEIQQLKNRCMLLESKSGGPPLAIVDAAAETSIDLNFDTDELIYLVGGFDGVSWSSGLNVYSPSQDLIKSRNPMNFSRSYASVAKLYGELYVLGGGDGISWYDSVESYNPAYDEWTLRPSLNGKKGSLAGVALDNKIFAIGGGNGVECFSDVEMMDLDIGRWIVARSMLQKRFALASAELNGVIYAVGGYDGKDYLKSSERFDPREHSWKRIGSMNTKRGCHSVAVLNEKLYAFGGFDGNAMVSSVEIFDPRLGSWVYGEPMNEARGYSAAATIGDSIYALGGVQDGDKIVEMVERYKEGKGWEATSLRAIGKRCFFSATTV